MCIEKLIKSLREAMEEKDVDFESIRLTFLEGAERGYPAAQSGLGLLYHSGLGVPVDKKLAFYWFERAAKQGFADAQYHLAILYSAGEGVAQDCDEAYTWFARATEQGHKEAREVMEKAIGSEAVKSILDGIQARKDHD